MTLYHGTSKPCQHILTLIFKIRTQADTNTQAYTCILIRAKAQNYGHVRSDIHAKTHNVSNTSPLLKHRLTSALKLVHTRASIQQADRQTNRQTGTHTHTHIHIHIHIHIHTISTNTTTTTPTVPSILKRGP